MQRLATLRDQAAVERFDLASFAFGPGRWFPPVVAPDYADPETDRPYYPSIVALAEYGCPNAWPENRVFPSDDQVPAPRAGESVSSQWMTGCFELLAQNAEASTGAVMDSLHHAFDAFRLSAEADAQIGAETDLTGWLVDSHRQWLKAREVSCALVSAGYMSGTGTNYAQAECRMNQTKARLAWLRDLWKQAYAFTGADLGDDG